MEKCGGPDGRDQFAQVAKMQSERRCVLGAGQAVEKPKKNERLAAETVARIIIEELRLQKAFAWPPPKCCLRCEQRERRCEIIEIDTGFRGIKGSSRAGPAWRRVRGSGRIALTYARRSLNGRDKVAIQEASQQQSRRVDFAERGRLRSCHANQRDPPQLGDPSARRSERSGPSHNRHARVGRHAHFGDLARFIRMDQLHLLQGNRTPGGLRLFRTTAAVPTRK